MAGGGDRGGDFPDFVLGGRHEVNKDLARGGYKNLGSRGGNPSPSRTTPRQPRTKTRITSCLLTRFFTVCSCCLVLVCVEGA